MEIHGVTIVGHFLDVFLENGHYSYASPIRIGESDPRAKPARQPILQVRNRPEVHAPPIGAGSSKFCMERYK